MQCNISRPFYLWSARQNYLFHFHFVVVVVVGSFIFSLHYLRFATVYFTFGRHSFVSIDHLYVVSVCVFMWLYPQSRKEIFHSLLRWKIPVIRLLGFVSFRSCGKRNRTRKIRSFAIWKTKKFQRQFTGCFVVYSSSSFLFIIFNFVSFCFWLGNTHRTLTFHWNAVHVNDINFGEDRLAFFLLWRNKEQIEMKVIENRRNAREWERGGKQLKDKKNTL